MLLSNGAAKPKREFCWQAHHLICFLNRKKGGGGSHSWQEVAGLHSHRIDRSTACSVADALLRGTIIWMGGKCCIGDQTRCLKPKAPRMSSSQQTVLRVASMPKASCKASAMIDSVSCFRGHLKEAGLFCQLLNGVAAVAQDALVAIDVGDG
jgi:hypothetical protein